MHVSYVMPFFFSFSGLISFEGRDFFFFFFCRSVGYLAFCKYLMISSCLKSSLNLEVVFHWQKFTYITHLLKVNAVNIKPLIQNFIGFNFIYTIYQSSFFTAFSYSPQCPIIDMSTIFSWVQFSCSVLSTLCNPMNRSTPGLPVHHQLPEFTQIHAHRVSDAIQPSHPLSSLSPPAPNPSQHQSLFQWVSSSHEMAKVLEFQF